MNALERLAAAGDNSVGGYSFIDADTLRDPDDPSKKYRLQGIDVPEVAGFKGEKGWTGGTAGGTEATQRITGLAQSQGYTNLVKLTNPDGSPQLDAFGRQLSELHNDKGENFATRLLETGSVDAGKYTTQEDLDAVEVVNAFGDQKPGADEFSEAASAIKDSIADESVGDMEFKRAASSEAEFAAGKGKYTSALSFRKGDRSLYNQAYNPLSDSWEKGWIGVKEGSYGFLELLGDSTGYQDLEDIGTAGIARAQVQQQEYAHALTSYKDVDSFGTAMQFLGNNAATSLPYMIGIVGAGAAGTLAAPVVGTLGAAAIGTGIPAAVYAGQTWNEMEGEKNAAVAVGAGLVQASLDKLGIGLITKSFKPKNAFSQGVAKIMAETGVSKAAASATLATATRGEIAGLVKESVKIATKQMAAKKVFQELIKKAGTGALGEAGTEAMQEATAYVAAAHGSDKVFNYEELNERIIGAAIAGGALGGGFATPGAIKNSIMSLDAEIGAREAKAEDESQAAQFAAEEKENFGVVASNKDNLDTIRAEVNAAGPNAGGVDLATRAETHRAGQKDKSLFDRVTEKLLNAEGLWQGATRNIFKPELLEKSRSARQMADLFGGQLQRTFSGANFETAKHHSVAIYKNMIKDPKQIYNSFVKGGKLNSAKKLQISQEIYSTANAAVNKDGVFDPTAIPDTNANKQEIIELVAGLERMSNKMWLDQKKYNPELGFEKNYLLTYKSMNKAAVDTNPKGFADLLVKKHGYSKADAEALAYEISNNNEVNDIDEAFSVIKGGIKPGSHKSRSLNLAQDPDFKEFMEQDIFANASAAAKSAARYTAHREFIGENGAMVNQMLANVEKDLGGGAEAKATVDKMAAQMQDYLDAESGNYKRPTSKAGKKAQALQKNIMMYMTLSGLPLATISSFVEVMLVNRGLTSEQVWGKKGSMKAMGTELGKTLWSGMESTADLATGKKSLGPQSEARTALKELGFLEWDVGAATVTGVTEVNARQQWIFESFFQATGLTGWTNYTRAARAAMAGDYLSDNADIVWKNKMSGDPRTRDVIQAEEKLRNLGLDVDRFTEIQTKITAGLELDPAEKTFMDDSVREATFNFVNEAVALPGASNRPLLYQDPRFALFTQFQGFIATFTANHIPKLWGEYVKRGTPAMKYNAFATMATMIMMGFASMALKDEIKYGFGDEEDKTGGNPYLDPADYIRRGITASGLLGTGERVLSAAFPIYESNSSGPIDWAFNVATGESPALGWTQRVAGAAGDVVKGDLGSAARQGVKALPIFGPFSFIAEDAEGIASNWNFNGE